MKKARLEQLLTFLNDDPKDPFNWYAVAVEYGDENPDKAWTHFAHLLEHHPEYVPTYYHAAALRAAQGHPEEARAIYERGIEVAQRAGEAKALGELRNAYQNFLFEEDY